NSYLVRAFGTGTLEARLRLSRFLGENTDLSILGNGLAGSGFFARKFDFVSEDVNYHNMFIDMIDAMGLVGLGFFLILLYVLIRAGLTNVIFQTVPETRNYLVALFGLLLAMLTVGHFNGAVFYFGRAIPVYFWSIAGILAHFERPASQSLSRDVIHE
ncbi:MAG TPA: hypothetical protein VJ044_19765, partial [Candidatus Hodarchaeales archaeon]|nr:hypothetical protein [Candidatus Hodarchaeales archaeon]